MSTTHPEQQDAYGFNPRAEVAPHIPRGASSALDVGCAHGGFSLTLRSGLGASARLVGVDPVSDAVQMARERSVFDEVLEGYFPDALRGRSERFDLVTFNDVLEHTVDPWAMLAAAHGVLSEEGRVLATIPNIQYAPVVWDLIRGRFDYTETGVLDRTHLRFFTKSGIEALFITAGFTVESITGVNNIIHDNPHRWMGHRRKLRHLLRDAQWTQFVVLARPR